MMRGKWNLFRVAAWLALGTASLSAANFAPPAEGPLAFRRDQIPLDSDSMTSLSHTLVTLIQTLDLSTAANRRTAAQMLALATALDPGNGRARNLIGELQKNHLKGKSEAGEDQIASGKKRVWEMLEWLETPEAGKQANSLAACLSDVIAVSDSRNPKTEALRAAGERGAWQGWIPQLSAYEPPVAVKVERPAKVMPASVPFLLGKAQVSTIIWKAGSNLDPAKWIERVTPLQMVAQVADSRQEGEIDRADEAENGINHGEKRQPYGFTLVIAPQLGGSAFRGVSATVTKLLKTRHPVLPAGFVKIEIPELTSTSMPPKRQSISAAAAVLASAAITGTEPEGCILGVIDEAGNYKLPSGFWGQLQALGSGNGGRLILPAAAAEYLPSMLALERPQIFLNYEILLASNFQELLERSAKTPDKSIEKSIASFREIQEKGRNQTLGQYVANPFVRKRLVEVVIDNPNHLSAKMLAIQGAGNRPVYVSRAVLAAELSRAIQPMEWLIAKRDPALEPSELIKLGDTSEVCRTQVDSLARYTTKEDRPLFDQVQNLVIGLRTLDRAARSRGDSYEVHSAVISAYSALMISHEEVAAELANLTGDSASSPDP
jgi:hypothetical protein